MSNFMKRLLPSASYACTYIMATFMKRLLPDIFATSAEQSPDIFS
jgi:hypothetical protein